MEFEPFHISNFDAHLLTYNLTKHCILIPFLGYIMMKVLLHFSDSKKGSSFGLESSSRNTKKQS